MNDVAEWVFRHAGGCLIDGPDLPVPRHRVAWRWIATLWPDPLAPDGWGSLEWTAGERGWLIPFTLMPGDVVEFGITTHDPSGRPIEALTARWYGWLSYATDEALVLRGPFTHPRTATSHARRMVDLIRLEQLSLVSAWDCSPDERSPTAHERE